MVLLPAMADVFDLRDDSAHPHGFKQHLVAQWPLD
jgi:hypothetical protein